MSKQGHFKRRPGQVITLRVRPDDCIRILDLADKTGVRGTFPQKVSAVINGLLVAAEQSGLIPEPDMFSYGRRMDEALGPRNGGVVAEYVAPGLNQKQHSIPSALDGYELLHTQLPRAEDAAVEFGKLDFKREFDPENFTSEDRQRMEECKKIAWPD